MEISKQGLIFSIKRFAIHDGKGLRTTIFFKGCNMHCQWCHNPEGLKAKQQVVLSNTKCINCKRCQSIDHDKVIKQYNNDKKIVHKEMVDYQKYIDICPTSAITYDSKYYTVEQLIEEVLKDTIFYRNEGGVTLSGGEALLQMDFIIAFLKKCKALNINTAIETALHIPTKELRKILPYVDTLYCDIKEMNTDKHYQFTKVTNTLILTNIEYLLTSKYASRIVIRTPLIPDYTATTKNIAAIARYISSLYSEVKYELLNYNPLALSKYIAIKEEFCLSHDKKMFTQEEMEQFKQIAKDNNIINIL